MKKDPEHGLHLIRGADCQRNLFCSHGFSTIAAQAGKNVLLQAQDSGRSPLARLTPG